MSENREDREAPPVEAETVCEDTQPAQEWGERLTTGRAIARGGHTSGPVPGATDAERQEPSTGKPQKTCDEQPLADS